MERWMRSLFLFLGSRPLFNRLAKRFGLRFGAGHFVAGETLDSVISVGKKLNQQGLMVTMDHLGEFVRTRAEAKRMTQHCIQTLCEIKRHQLDANLSLKLTSIGLDLDESLCLDHMSQILEEAKRRQIFVRIDMEDYARLDKTFRIYELLRSDYTDVGLVIQAYLYRSSNDVQKLRHWNTNLRLVKGAYKESPDVAFATKKDVDEHFCRLIQLQLELGNYAAIATHDEVIIEFAKQLVKELKIPLEQFEFQMLYGIRKDLQQQLVKEGYRVRVYVPYGVDWYGYFMRRLAERPANVAFVLKGIIKGR